MLSSSQGQRRQLCVQIAARLSLAYTLHQSSQRTGKCSSVLAQTPHQFVTISASKNGRFFVQSYKATCLELWQVCILCWHFIGEPLHHGLLNLPHVAQCLLLLDGDLLLVLCIQQHTELLQTLVQGSNRLEPGLLCTGTATQLLCMHRLTHRDRGIRTIIQHPKLWKENSHVMERSSQTGLATGRAHFDMQQKQNLENRYRRFPSVSLLQT